jgi:hypothetical protein
MAIPWAEVEVYDGHLDATFSIRPGSNTAIRANLCRHRAATGELTSWSQMLRGPPEPEHFGVWTFAGQPETP